MITNIIYNEPNSNINVQFNCENVINYSCTVTRLGLPTIDCSCVHRLTNMCTICFVPLLLLYFNMPIIKSPHKDIALLIFILLVLYIHTTNTYTCNHQRRISAR